MSISLFRIALRCVGLRPALGAGVTAAAGHLIIPSRAPDQHGNAAEGFGVLAGMDIGAAARDKLHVPFRDYVILGACMPALAHQAILAETDIGLLLPLPRHRLCDGRRQSHRDRRARSYGRALPHRQPGNSPTGGAGEAAASPRARGRQQVVAIAIASKRQPGALRPVMHSITPR
jgi:hypothetical protein